MDFNNLAVSISMLSSSSNPTVVKRGTSNYPTIAFAIPVAPSTSPNLSIGSVNTSTNYSTFGASITGTNPNYILNIQCPEFITSNTNQSITGIKTFNNFELDGVLQLTNPAVNLTQTQLSFLTGASSNIQTQLNNKLNILNPLINGNLNVSGNCVIDIDLPISGLPYASWDKQ